MNDPVLIQKLAEYMQKSGSISADARTLFENMYAHIDTADQKKTASAAVLQDQVKTVVDRMVKTKLASGTPLIYPTVDTIKDASARLSDHSATLELFGMVLDAVQEDQSKTASLEPGYAVTTQKTASKSDEESISAFDQLARSCGVRS